jgi:PAP2 superfamily C-terminal
MLSLKRFVDTRLVISIGYFLICYYMMCYSQIVVDRISYERNYGIILTDWGFTDLPEQSSFDNLPNLILFIFFPVTIFSILLLNPHRARIAKRSIFILGSVFGLRALAIRITVLPNPYPQCVYEGNTSNSDFYEALKVGIFQRVTCGDVMFSGHTAAFTFTACFFTQYSRTVIERLQLERIFKSSTVGTRWFCVLISWLIAIFGYFTILMTHFHYSIDIMMGACLTVLIWSLHHQLVKNQELMELLPFIKWFDHDDDDETNRVRPFYSHVVFSLCF